MLILRRFSVPRAYDVPRVLNADARSLQALAHTLYWNTWHLMLVSIDIQRQTRWISIPNRFNVNFKSIGYDEWSVKKAPKSQLQSNKTDRTHFSNLWLLLVFYWQRQLVWKSGRDRCPGNENVHFWFPAMTKKTAEKISSLLKSVIFCEIFYFWCYCPWLSGGKSATSHLKVRTHEGTGRRDLFQGLVPYRVQTMGQVTGTSPSKGLHAGTCFTSN